MSRVDGNTVQKCIHEALDLDWCDCPDDVRLDLLVKLPKPEQYDGDEATTLPTLIRCVICSQEWELDFEPPACVCDDGGFYQISVNGDAWEDQAQLGG